MKVLKLLLTNDTLLSGSEREEFLHGILQKFFLNTNVFDELTNDELFWLWEKHLIDTFTFLDDTSNIVPQEVSALQKVISRLYIRRSTLNARQLLKLFAYSTPSLSPESQAIIDELYKKEQQQQESFTPIALSSPSSFPSTKKLIVNPDLDDKTGFIQNKTTMQYFKFARNETWILDTVLHMSFSKEMSEPNHVDNFNKSINFSLSQKITTCPYSITLLAPLKPSKVAVLYCSFPPIYDVSSTYLIGILSSSSPTLPINPSTFLPHYLTSAPTINVRLGCKVVEQKDIRKYVGSDIVTNPIQDFAANRPESPAQTRTTSRLRTKRRKRITV